MNIAHRAFRSAKNRDHGRVGHPRDGGQLGESEVRDPAKRAGPGLHILVPEQQEGAGLRQGCQGDQQRAGGRQHDGGHFDHQQRGAARLGQLHVSAVQLRLGQRVPARIERYVYALCNMYSKFPLCRMSCRGEREKVPRYRVLLKCFKK